MTQDVFPVSEEFRTPSPIAAWSMDRFKNA